MKTCTACKTKSFEGKGSWCYECRSSYSKDYRAGKLRGKSNACPKCKIAERAVGKGYCNKCSAAYSKQYADKPEVRDRLYQKLYGIGVDEYESRLVMQAYKCAICLIHQDSLTTRLSVDHRHSDGKVRGLLCGPCNTYLGLIQEDTSRLLRMIGYLNDA